MEMDKTNIRSKESIESRTVDLFFDRPWVRKKTRSTTKVGSYDLCTRTYLELIEQVSHSKTLKIMEFFEFGYNIK